MEIISGMLNNIGAFFAQYLLIFKLISFFISMGLLALIVFFLMHTETVSGPIDHFSDVLGFRDISRSRAIKAWKQIKEKLGSGDKKQWKQAVVEADAIFDEALRISGYNGKDFNERLEAADHVRFFNISVEEIKEAHRLKDRIVSDPDFSIELNEAEVIVRMYKSACQELSLS